MKKFAVPLVLFALLGLLLAYGLRLDPRKIPSPLIGKPLSNFSLATVSDPGKRLGPADLRGQVYLLNVWASWCVACREEHPVLVDLSRRGEVTLIGLNYKDKREDALQWLRALGNPYRVSLADTDGRVGIDLGVYGVPETFVIDRDGIIRYKHIGPVTPDVLASVLLPKVAELGGSTPSPTLAR